MNLLRKAGKWVALALVGLSAMVGIRGGISDLPLSRTLAQHFVSIAILMYGSAGGAALFAYWKRLAWGWPAILVWGIGAVSAPPDCAP